MKLAPRRINDRTAALRVEGGTLVEVGRACKPARYVTGGETVVTTTEDIGRVENRVVNERS